VGRRKGPIYTRQQAEERIPIVLRRIALCSVECMLKLEKHPFTSYEVESEIFTLEGLIGHLIKLAHVIYRDEAKSKLAAESME